MRKVLLDKRVQFESGTNWASDPIRLEQGWVVELDCVGTTRFYSLLVTNDYYDTARSGRFDDSFPFKFGTDRTARLEKYRAQKTDYYRVVARVGAWSEGGTVNVRLVLVGKDGDDAES